MKIRLVVVDPARDGELVAEGAFDGPEVVFGRRAGVSQFVIPDPSKQVSSRHGCFFEKDGQWRVRDLGSLNGTFLGGEKITEEDSGMAVGHGDILTVGGLEMQFLEKSVTPLADIEATRMQGGNTSGRVAELAEELEGLWSENADAEHSVRTEAVESRLRAGISDLMPEQVKAVMQKLAARWGGGPEPSTADEQQEKLYRAGFETLVDLSRATVDGDDVFGSADQVERFVQLVRQCIELTGEWVARNLKARESFGEQFGAEVSLIFKRSANPLKKEADHEKMVRYLLDWREKRPPGNVRYYLQGIFEDLSSHQMGVLAGVRDAVDAVVARLDPEKVTAEAERQGWSLASAGARAWDSYRKLYAELVADRSRLFAEVVRPAIARGYLDAHAKKADAPSDDTSPPDEGL